MRTKTQKPDQEMPGLNSEREIVDLMKLSESLAPGRHQEVFHYHKVNSSILNPARKASIPSLFLDLAGAKGLLANYNDSQQARDESGYTFAVGAVGTAENALRSLWRRFEYHCRCNGYPINRLPIGNQAEDIAEVAAKLKVIKEEVAKLEKFVKETETKTKERQRIERGRIGAVKRSGPPRYWITQVDGMEVDEKGVITETGQLVAEYLAEIKAERARKRGISPAAAA